MMLNNYLAGVRTLGLDLDGPVYRFGSPFRDWLIARGWPAEQLDPNPVATYNLLATWPLTTEQLLSELVAASNANAIYVNAENVLNMAAAEWIPRIHAAGIRIHLVTARSEPRAEQQSRDFMTANNLPFDKITVARHDKENVLDFDVLLDDSPNNVRRVIGSGRKAVLLDCAWNQDATDLPRATWDDFGTALLSSATTAAPTNAIVHS